MVLSLKYNKIPDISGYVGNIVNKFDNKTAETLSKTVGYDTKKLWTDYQMINRLLYRSQNQHKASLAFRHLKEVKRLGERIGKLELWLKGNLNDSEMLFDFTGYLNTLRLLIEMAVEAGGKAFYFYMQYLDQALFVQLSLVAVGCVSSICKEFKQWLKYINLLYRSCLDKLKALKGVEVVEKWRIENHLPLDVTVLKEEGSKGENEKRTTTSTLFIETETKSTPSTSVSISRDIPSLRINNPTSSIKMSKPKPATTSASKYKKKPNKYSPNFGIVGDEIDDIFNNL